MQLALYRQLVLLLAGWMLENERQYCCEVARFWCDSLFYRIDVSFYS